MLQDYVAGFYDPKRKTLFIADSVTNIMLDMVVSHEIVHGLQDMHFNLADKLEPIWHEQDKDMARTFLIEGEAQAVVLAWRNRDDPSAIHDALLDTMANQVLRLKIEPYPVLVRMLQFPYQAGEATVWRLAQAKGWQAVTELYKTPPDTTEQMLHIDKLLAREPAVSVHVTAEPLAAVLGLKPIWHDTIGEANLLSMMAEVEPPAVARKAAAGWGGDHYVVLDQPGTPMTAPVIVGAIAWDNPRDAKEFETSFAKYVQTVIGRPHWIERKRDRVAFALQLPQAADPSLRAAAWRAISVGAAAAQAKEGRL
jgi:hypothetical protein